MKQIRVDIVSPEEAANGNAELWVGRELLGVTTIVDSTLRLELSCRAGTVCRVSADPASVDVALLEARRLIADAG